MSQKHQTAWIVSVLVAGLSFGFFLGTTITYEMSEQPVRNFMYGQLIPMLTCDQFHKIIKDYNPYLNLGTMKMMGINCQK